MASSMTMASITPSSKTNIFTPVVTRGKSQLRKLGSSIKKRLYSNSQNKIKMDVRPKETVNDQVTRSTLPYTMNKARATDKKLCATSRDDITCEMTGGGLVLTLSTAYYEGFKTAVAQFLDQSTYTVALKVHTDESDHDIQNITYTVSEPGTKLYVINCYNNNSRVLVNGKHLDYFTNNDCYLIMELIGHLKWDGKPINWTHLNDLIRCKLQSLSSHNHETPATDAAYEHPNDASPVSTPPTTHRAVTDIGSSNCSTAHVNPEAPHTAMVNQDSPKQMMINQESPKPALVNTGIPKQAVASSVPALSNEPETLIPEGPELTVETPVTTGTAANVGASQTVVVESEKLTVTSKPSITKQKAASLVVNINTEASPPTMTKPEAPIPIGANTEVPTPTMTNLDILTPTVVNPDVDVPVPVNHEATAPTVANTETSQLILENTLVNVEPTSETAASPPTGAYNMSNSIDEKLSLVMHQLQCVTREVNLIKQNSNDSHDSGAIGANNVASHIEVQELRTRMDHLHNQLLFETKQREYFQSKAHNLLDSLHQASKLQQISNPNPQAQQDRTATVAPPAKAIQRYYLCQGPNDPLSNLYQCEIEVNIKGQMFVFYSVEHAFQYMKAHCLGEMAIARKIIETKSAGFAKKLGDGLNSHPNIQGWISTYEQNTMYDLLKTKFRMCPAFRDKLTNTNDAVIFHSVVDSKWGIGQNTTDIIHPIDISSLCGHNLHGKMLMSLRKSPPPVFHPNGSSTKSRIELIGSSLLNGVDETQMSRLADVHKITAFTIKDAYKIDLHKMRSDSIILHLTTNDLKVNSPDQVINDMKSLVNHLQSKLPNCKLAISHAPLQATDGDMNQRIRVVNATLDLIFQNSAVRTFSNDNIDPNTCLTRDGVHLNQKGSRVLANNIRSMIKNLTA